MQRLLYLLIFPVLWIISLFPMRMLYITSDILFVLLYYIVGYRKKTVRENLELVFPEKSIAEKRTIEKKFYRHLCDMIVEAVKSLTISESELLKRFVPTNVEEVNAIEQQNKSIVLMLAHYASWEWIFILQKYVTHKTHAIYKKLRNKYFDALIKRSRAKYNTSLITTKEAIPTLMRSKAKGELTFNGFISDQSPKVTNVYHWNDFMNIKVPVFTGAELMAKRLDMAVVFCAVKRVKRGYYEATFKTITLNPKEYKDYEITDIFLRLVETQIREAPEYYLWTHKRWKHRDKVPAEFK